MIITGVGPHLQMSATPSVSRPGFPAEPQTSRSSPCEVSHEGNESGVSQILLMVKCSLILEWLRQCATNDTRGR